MATPARIQAKSAYLGGRCTQKQKIKIQRAAELCGISVTEFTISTLMEKADKIIKQHCIIELSMTDQKAFAGVLLNPPAPNKALFSAKKHHQKLIRT